MARVTTDYEKIKELLRLNRYIEKIYPSAEFLEKRLIDGEQLSVYIGFDPTSPDLHLGHSTNFLFLKRFQELGHRVIIVIGDFTARIGDPSGKDLTRKPLPKEEIERNFATYKNQIGKILDLGETEFKYNSKWLEKLSLKDLIKLFSFVTTQQLLERDMFQQRIKEGKPIGLHEFIYPLLQGYDSVAMNIDGEVGGNDQTFNMLMGRHLEKKYLEKEKFVVATRLLVNPQTGRKMMNKSEGGYVSLQDKPLDMYGKVMALPDEATFDLFEMCTEIPLDKIDYFKSGDILNAKHELAYEITKIYHGSKNADSAREEFNRIFREGEIPTEIPRFEFKEEKINIVDLMLKTGLAESASEAKRLIEQKAVRIDDEIIDDWREEIKSDGELVLKVGPRRFARIKKR